MNKYKKHSIKITIDTLADITVSIASYPELLDSVLILKFIDHYRAYVQHYSDEMLWNIPMVRFEDFITNQVLLNLAASHIALEAGEPETALVAIECSTQQHLQ